MSHTHSPKSTRTILGSELYECSCGARKWSNGRAIVGAVIDVDGWYVAEVIETKTSRVVEMIETEGYGYDWNKQDVNDPLDSQFPNID